MTSLRRYNVTVNGHATTLQLTEDDAKRYPDATPVDQPAAADAKAKVPANKAKTPANKAKTGGGSD